MIVMFKVLLNAIPVDMYSYEYEFYCQIAIYLSLFPPALGLAVARDGSSGGVLRLATIEEGGVTRSVFTGPEIPQFYDK